MIGDLEFLNKIYNNEQLEQLFDELDRHLHKITYLQLEDKVFGLEVDIEEMQSTIDYYRELIEEKGIN